MKASKASELTLQKMPLHLIMETDTPMSVQCPGLPENHFPLSPATTYWNLPSEPGERMQVKSIGFPLIPYFSSTIDSITGKTVDKGIMDTGDWTESTSYYRAMKIYIALSRVKKADDILLTNMLSPCLFRCGPFPWPTRLMQHMRQDGQELKPEEHVAIQKMDSKRFLLKDMSWWCKKCGKTQH